MTKSDAGSDDWLPGALVLLTGATGRVGIRVAERLLDRGARVRTVVLPGDPGRDRLPAAVEVVEGSLTDTAVIRTAVDGVDGMLHLAALMDWNPGAEYRLWDANVSATFYLLEQLRSRETVLRRVLIVSSDEIYPALDVGREIVEDLPARPYSFYGLTKQLDEVLAGFYHRVHNMPISTVRFALTAAPEEIARHDGWSGRLFFASGLRNLLSALGRDSAVATLDAVVNDHEKTLVIARDEQGRSYRFQFCDVRDLVDGILLLATQPQAVGEVFNLSGPEAFSYDEIVPRLAEALQLPYVDLNLPGERFDVSTSTSKAQDLLGYRPKYGIREIIDALPGRQP